MKKLTLSVFGILFLALSPKVSFAQPVQEGYTLLEVTYGFPNLYSAVLKSAYVNSQEVGNAKFGELGPIGIRGEYFVSDRAAIGVEFVYTSNSLSYTEDGMNSSGQPVTNTYDLQVTKFRIMPKFSFHYGNADKVDFYTSIGAGYKRVNYTIDSSTDDFDDEELRNFLPIAFRVATGARFFFTENIGATLEFGLGGGGLITGGFAIML